ncbi:hypothetical protein H0Z60_10020 [Ectothiorhodospiraceae bacterium WFHF3C12]|nr:hypothetical protein [Ectothiorhodospiraceae bacterium WFHF3C12]
MMGADRQFDWIAQGGDLQDKRSLVSNGGVGGRHKNPSTATEGGGYLNACRAGNPGLKKGARDPRLDELEQIGLDPRWLRIAHVVGVDQFLEVWQILDEENIDLPPGEREPTRIRIPLFAGWMRLQRNKLVKALADEGSRPSEIRRTIRRKLCESLSERHITRIIEAAKHEST